MRDYSMDQYISWNVTDKASREKKRSALLPIIFVYKVDPSPEAAVLKLCRSELIVLITTRIMDSCKFKAAESGN